MEWSKTHVTSTFHICWAAQAGLYYHYGVRKELLDEKIFGIFQHHTIHRKTPLIRGFDDVFNAPHSRHSQIVREDVEKNSELTILADSEEAGPGRAALYADQHGKGQALLPEAGCIRGTEFFPGDFCPLHPSRG